MGKNGLSCNVLKLVIICSYGSFFHGMSSTASSLLGEEVKVYPGFLSYYDYTIYKRNRTWFEAHHECERYGGFLTEKMGGSLFKYIISTATKNNWPMPMYVWVNWYKRSTDDVWYYPRDCDMPVNMTVNNQSQADQQCMQINPRMPDVRFAVSCNLTAAYICYFLTGGLFGNSGSYNLYERMDVTKIMLKLSTVNQTLSDCIEALFSHCFSCYAAVYDNVSTVCEVYKDSPDKFPFYVHLTPTFHDQIVVLKNATKVYYNNTDVSSEEKYGNVEYPCPPSPTSTSGTTDVSMGMAGSSCECYCYKSNKSYGMIQDEIEERAKELLVEKTSLSFYIQQKHSAPDDRGSSSTMGYVAGIALALITSFVCFGDFLTAVRVSFTFIKTKVSGVNDVTLE